MDEESKSKLIHKGINYVHKNYSVSTTINKLKKIIKKVNETKEQVPETQEKSPNSSIDTKRRLNKELALSLISSALPVSDTPRCEQVTRILHYHHSQMFIQQVRTHA